MTQAIDRASNLSDNTKVPNRCERLASMAGAPSRHHS